MSNTSIADQLSSCYNFDCHEGEFNILGKKITVFTREPVYHTDETGNIDFSREPISDGGDKCAFIDDTYWTGWYYPNCMEDLKACMTDVTKHLFEDASIKFTITGTLKENIFSNFIENYIPEDHYEDEPYYHDPEESGNYTDEELLNAFKQELSYCYNIDESDIKSFNIIELDRVNYTFKAEIYLYNYILFDFFKDEYSLVTYNDWSYNYYVIDSISFTFEHEEEIKEYMKNAFSYTLSF